MSDLKDTGQILWNKTFFFFELHWAYTLAEDLVKIQITSVALGWGLRLYNSHRLPGGATAAGCVASHLRSKALEHHF